MTRRLVWLLAALAVAAIVLEVVAFLSGWHAGPFHAPTDDGYWGGV